MLRGSLSLQRAIGAGTGAPVNAVVTKTQEHPGLLCLTFSTGTLSTQAACGCGKSGPQGRSCRGWARRWQRPAGVPGCAHSATVRPQSAKHRSVRSSLSLRLGLAPLLRAAAHPTRRHCPGGGICHVLTPGGSERCSSTAVVRVALNRRKPGGCAHRHWENATRRPRPRRGVTDEVGASMGSQKMQEQSGIHAVFIVHLYHGLLNTPPLMLASPCHSVSPYTAP